MLQLQLFFGQPECMWKESSSSNHNHANMTYSCEIDDKLKIVPLLFLFVFAPTNSLSQAFSYYCVVLLDHMGKEWCCFMYARNLVYQTFLPHSLNCCKPFSILFNWWQPEDSGTSFLYLLIHCPTSSHFCCVVFYWSTKENNVVLLCTQGLLYSRSQKSS